MEHPLLVLRVLLLAILLTALYWRERKELKGRRNLLWVWLAFLAWLGLALFAEELRLVDLSLQVEKWDIAQKWGFALSVLLSVNAGLQLFEYLIWDRVVARMGDRPLPRLLINVFNLIALILTLMWLLTSVFGQELTTLLVTSTVASAVIGLALQDVLRSLVAGVVLQVERPLSLGDWVEIAGQEGRIVQQNWRTITLRTRTNHHVTLTNSSVADQEIINFSRPARLQAIDAYIGIAYSSPPEQVKAVLRRALSEVPDVRSTPAPRIYTLKYNDFSIDYRIRYWIVDFAKLRDIEDAVMTRLWYAVERAGMRIPFPIRDVRVQHVPEDQADRQQAQRQESIKESLRPLEFLEPLDDEHIAHIAAGARLLRFASGELLMRENEPGESLFLIRQGCARIEVDSPSGARVRVAERRAGEIIGEMSLLTGEPRSATVVAEDEVEVIEVHKECFRGVLLADETIADSLCAILARRESERSDRLAEAEGMVSEQSMRRDFVAKVRNFFALN